MSDAAFSVGIFGLGGAGVSLAKTFRQRGVTLAAVGSRRSTFDDENVFRDICSLDATLSDNDILFLSVSDDVLLQCAAPLADRVGGPAVVHLAGRLPANHLHDVVPGRATGVFHPMASMKGLTVVGKGIGVRRQSDDVDLHLKLDSLVEWLGWSVVDVNADDVVRYHLAAVMTANLTGALLGAGRRLLIESGVDGQSALAALSGLLSTVIGNARDARTVEDFATGPIVRGDLDAVKGLAAQLDDDSTLQAAFFELGRLLVRELDDTEQRKQIDRWLVEKLRDLHRRDS